MIFITDIGKDIDDAVALTYAIIAGIPIKNIITTSKDSVDAAKICQNIINNLLEKYPDAQKIKVYSGSTEPIKGGTSHGCTYTGYFRRGDFPIEKFEPLKVPADDAIVICPLTDMISLMENKRIKRAIFMGQAKKDHQTLLPDMDAYNFRCDPFASEAVFQFQDRIPFAFITKQLAYRVPLQKSDFEKMASTGHPVGEFLYNHAIETFENFKFNAPDLYTRIYEGTDNISYCYDPLTVLALKRPGLFTFEKFGKHRIGVDLKSDEAKKTLINIIINGLK